MKYLMLSILHSLLGFAQCAKILGVFPAPGYSQFILAEVLMKELANRGHHITVIAPYVPKNAPPNYKTIKTEDVLGSVGIADYNFFDHERESPMSQTIAIYEYGNWLTESTLKNQQVQELLHSNENFDLVIVEQFFNDAMKAFATHFQTPLVLFSSMGSVQWNKEYMGNPQLPSINAMSYTRYTNNMKFFQRIRNTFGVVVEFIYKRFVFYPRQKNYLKEYFPNDIEFNNIVNNASLMLLNSHVTTSENSLLPYNMIEIGGFHVTAKPLEKSIQSYLDSAKDGAILFSLGSNLKSSDLHPETLDSILKALGNLPQKVLWKFEKDLPNKPDNVLISKWLKQSDILAHPNIRLFISHCGLLSTTEAIYNGVPIVGIPIFADPKMNLARAIKNGIASIISFQELSGETLFAAIKETLNNPKYRQNVKKMSALLKDRPMKPLDSAVYWIEYVIRHKGMRFEAAASKLYWFEVYMLDIFCFILLNILFVFVIAKRVVVCICSTKFNVTNDKPKQQ